jgi:hypothetical protein
MNAHGERLSRFSSKPRTKIIKSIKKLNIDYLSRLPLYGYEFRHLELKKNSALGCFYFSAYLNELKEVLKTVGPALNKKCDFDWEKLVQIIEERQLQLPRTDDEIIALIQDEQRTRAERPSTRIEPPPYHSKKIPSVIPVARYHGGSYFIGHYEGDKQFWGQVVATFREAEDSSDPDDWQSRKCWYAILHTFDKAGKHTGTKHEFVGTTADGEAEACDKGEKKMLEFIEELGPVTYGGIAIRQFQITIDRSIFGMVETSSEEFGDSVTMQPGELCFYPPWNGDYDS